MLFKRGNQCLITTLPSNFYPVDVALGMKEIVDVVREEDSLVQHSVLLDGGEMTAAEVSSLKQPILDECSPSTSPTFRRVTEAKVTAEQAATLEDGGVVFLPQESTRACSIMVSTVGFILLLQTFCSDRRDLPTESWILLALAQSRLWGSNKCPQCRP